MNKEVISDKQGIYLVIILLVGSSSIMVMGIQAGKDAWLAVLLGIAISFPITLIYARLHFIFLGKDLFDILEICFGKIIGKGICLLYVWFTLHHAALILENVGTFINTVSLYRTPIVIPTIVIAIMAMWAVKKGIKVMCEWIVFFLPIIVILLGAFVFLLIPRMRINNVLPVMNNGIIPIIYGGISVFTFPFAETYVFTMIFTRFDNKKSPYKIHITGLLIGGFMMYTIALTNLLVLSVNTVSTVYYPTYLAATRVKIFNVLQRFEVIIGIVLVLGAFMKISIFLFASCKGVAKTFGFREYGFIALPMGLMSINATYFQNDSIMEIFEFAEGIWPYYSSVFQVILPCIIWIAAEIRKKQLN
ncbi:MAG: endospore germination permease [Maledivibacter sp.]|jgi:spore germination protein KB|nr:endospore germination permease [Maledivibacter sp.]